MGERGREDKLQGPAVGLRQEGRRDWANYLRNRIGKEWIENNSAKNQRSAECTRSETTISLRAKNTESDL